MDVREEHPQKALSPIDVTPFAKVTSVSSRSKEKLSLPEYTADLGILGRIWEGFGKCTSGMKEKVLTALESGVIGHPQIFAFLLAFPLSLSHLSTQ
jgi:hypothetical protein